MLKISVIIPVYNSEKYLKRCLDSVINQTLKEIEIIVVNDGSTDNSLKIMKSYQDKITIINHPKNQGIGKSRNDGLKIAQGEYISFVDSDDYLKLDMLEQYYNYGQSNKLDVVTSHYYKAINDKIKLFKNNFFVKSNYQTNPNLINLIDLGPCNKIFKRTLLINNKIKFEEKLKFEDVPFVLKSVYHANMIGHLNQAYYYYCVRDKSETTTVDSRTQDIFGILKIVNNYFQENSLELEYLNVKEVTRYMLRQKYNQDKKIKEKFIETGYSFLNNNFPNWKKNKYYLNEPFFKKIIKNNKTLLKIYINLR